MFEKATRIKLRYAHNGVISVEDLWDLSLESLDAIFKKLNRRAKLVEEESLLETRSQEDDELHLAIEIVKHIVAVRLQERAERESEVEKRAQKQKLLAILEQKQDAELHDLPADKLQEMIAAL